MITTLLYSLFAVDGDIAAFAAKYGPWLYALLFCIIFVETGLVVFPFLPGDAMLFIAGTIVAGAGLNVHVLAGVLVVAAFMGDTLNYAIGHLVGPRVFERPDSRFLRQEHLRRTQAFYAKYGGATIVIGRFIPIIRTFAPFLAGVAGMRYGRFLAFNLVGGITWICSLTYSGYLFGNIPLVRENLTWIVLGIVALTLIPTVRAFMRERRVGSSRRRQAR